MTLQLWTPRQWLALPPILVVGLAAAGVMLAIAVKRHPKGTATITAVGLTLALSSLLAYFWLPGGSTLALPQRITPLLVIDRYAGFYMALILVAALATARLSHAYLEGYAGNREELDLLLLLSTLGGLVLVASRHFASLFLGLELLSVPMYGMIAYHVMGRRSLEAGLKYLVLAAVASAFIVFGMALVYAQTGTLVFGEIGERSVQLAADAQSVLLLGGALLLIGIGFKLSLAPFHLWTPDVYEGAPVPVTGYMATVSKVAVFALLLRYFVAARGYRYDILLDVLSGLAILSIVIGNALALQQENFKRLLAYSAIAHVGYLLVALIASGALAVKAVGVYLLTYVVTTLAAFGVITLMSSPYKDVEAERLADYRGLFWRHPGLAGVLTVALLSLAGVPLTAGFIGKFYVVGTGVNARLWLLLAAVVLGSAVGLYYYLRAMVQPYLPSREAAAPPPAPLAWVRGVGGGTLILLMLAVLALGVYPGPFIALARAAGLAFPG